MPPSEFPMMEKLDVNASFRVLNGEEAVQKYLVRIFALVKRLVANATFEVSSGEEATRE